MEKLQALLDDGIIDEVYSQLKTGKEAEVWLVSHRGEAVAAKLYKEREFRNFKNDAGYREGRQVRNSRTQRAMDRGSKFGRAASEEAWKSAEADAMELLHKLGVHVPRPVLFYDGVLLMEVIGDAEGRVAPRLVETTLTKEQASQFYVQLRGDVVKMLAADLIHGDLSEFNILLGAKGPVIIDFPQVVTAAKNSQSEQYFRRDLGNLLRFFGGFDATLNEKHAADADEIWRAYVRRYISPHFVPGARPQGGKPQHPPRRDGAPQQRREVSFNNGQPRRDGAPQQRREVSFNNGQPRRDGAPQQRRDASSQNGQPRRDGGPPQQRRDGAGDNGQPRRDGAPAGQQQQQRRGPEVSFRGAAPARPASGGGNPGGGHRRRPKRHF